MRYKVLGRTGLRVSELCLGSMTFGEDWGWGAPKDECARIVDAFAEAGGNFIDTACCYTNGSSERIVGELIRGDRDHWVVATKYGLNDRPEDPNAGGGHRKSIVRQLEGSLRRLGTDYIDLYWLHAWDAFTPVEEVVRELDDLVRAGKVLSVGISDTAAWRVAQAVTLADLRGLARFAGLQVPYNLARRDVESDLLPMARALDITVTTWEPLAAGLLSGRYGTDRENPPGTRIMTTEYRMEKLTPRNLAVADRLNEVAAERDATAAQVAIAWLRAQRHRAAIVPILGARRREQIEDSLGALQVDLTPAELERLDEVSRVPLGFPHDYEELHLAYGETYGLIDNGQVAPSRNGPEPGTQAAPRRNGLEAVT